MLSALEFIKTDFFWIEIDLDAPKYCEQRHDFERFLNRNRQFISFSGKNAAYIHICEGAPT
jgi:formiminoglutamase